MANVLEDFMRVQGLLGRTQAPSPGAGLLASNLGGQQGPQPGAPPAGGRGGTGPANIQPPPPVRLSPEQEDQIRKQQLLQTGLGILASGQQQPGITRIAQGIITGLQGKQQAQNRALEAQEAANAAERRRRVGEEINVPDLEREDVDRAISMSIAQGDNETVDRLIKLRNSLPGEEEEFKPEAVSLADGTKAVFDPNERAFFAPDGTPMTELPEDVAKEDDELKYVTGVDPATGQPTTGVINLDRGTFTPVEGVVDPDTMKSQTQEVDPDAIQTAEQATLLRKNFSTMQDYLINEDGSINPPPSAINKRRFEEEGTLLKAANLRKLPPEDQAFLQAQEAILLELANKLAGVRGISSEQARAAITRAFGFQQGDSPSNIKQTLKDIEIRTRSLEMQAGGALKMFDGIVTPENEDEDAPDEVNRIGEGL